MTASWLDDDARVANAMGELGRCPPTELVAMRRSLHFALQPVAAHGFSVVTPVDDFRHTAGHWDRARRAIVGALSSEPPYFRAGLELEGASLVLIAEDDEPIDRFEIVGATLDEAYAWYEEAASAVRRRPVTLVRPAHELPADPVGAGARFGALDVPAAHELAGWFELADAALARVIAHVPGVGARRLWPHHFDLATLVEISEGRTIGIGLSPGDASYAEPYFYVTPWPYPAADASLPGLPTGAHWHREGWTGAVLTATAVLDGGVALLDAYLRSSHAGLRELLA